MISADVMSRSSQSQKLIVPSICCVEEAPRISKQPESATIIGCISPRLKIMRERCDAEY